MLVGIVLSLAELALLDKISTERVLGDCCCQAEWAELCICLHRWNQYVVQCNVCTG